MLQTEFVRSLNSNYERVLLDKKPEEKKYQYCMLSRGGIKGLLSCNLRYINGLAYLYYDITSKQSVAQLFERKLMSREWVKDFVWGIKQIRVELSRFLLDGQNVLWYPQQVFQDLENNIFSFLYVPYYQEENGFLKMLEFMVEHIDYEDERLIECVYKMYEQYEKCGEVYLQEQIFEDIKMLEEEEMKGLETIEADICESDILKNEDILHENTEVGVGAIKQAKKGIFSLLENRKKKEKQSRSDYHREMQLSMSGYAVAEDTIFEEGECGRTLYVEEVVSQVKEYKLYTPKGVLVIGLDKAVLTIGKKKGEVDLVLEDASISRLHVRITKESDAYYLEDMNSTNGTFKNGLRMQPYEKRKLEEGDEIKIGKEVLIFRQ